MGLILGVILAGGLSRRMGGGDKPLLELAGWTLLDRVVTRFAPQCPAGLILNANGEPRRFVGFPGPIVPDDLPDHPGPLAGLLAALDHGAEIEGVTEVASVAGDTPFLPYDLVEKLRAARAMSGIAIAASGGRAHYTVGLWPVALRIDLRRFLVDEAGRRVGGFLERHAVATVHWACDPVDPFLNINTPDDLAAAQMLARIAPP